MRWPWRWHRPRYRWPNGIAATAWDAMARAREDLAETKGRRPEVERLAAELRRALGTR